MREIKFNFYNTKSKIYTRWGNSNAGMPMIAFSTFEHLKFLQYTGLKDKNDKEIYEGDILKCKVTKRFFKHEYDLAGETETIFKLSVIEWWESFSNIGYRLRDTKGKTMMVKPSSLHKMEVEVIGNIYENPELLEEK